MANPGRLIPAALFVLLLTAAAHAATDVWSHGSGLSSDTWGIGVDPGTPTTVYTGGLHGGVYRSTDGGTTWSPANTGLGTGAVWAIAVDPFTPSTVYAGTQYGLYKSTDGAGTWSPVVVGTTGTSPCVQLALDPTTPGLVYVRIIGLGLWRSTDNGASWGLALDDVQAFAIDPAATPAIVDALADPPATGFYRSTNGGVTWTHVAIGGLGGAVAADPVTPSTVYAGSFFGVSKSTDSGATWTPTSFLGGGSFVYGLLVDPDAPNTIYATVEDSAGSNYEAGFWVSADGGASWSMENTGLTSRRLHALALSSGSPRRLYAATDGGPFQMDLVCNHDAVVDPGEQCDDPTNGQPLACCSIMCNIRTGSDCTADGDLCTRDVCDAAGACTHPVAPLPPGRCVTPSGAGGAALKLRIPQPGQTRATFKWSKGETSRIPLPHPGSAGVVLCVYEQTGPDAYAIALRGSPGGGPWTGSDTTGWSFSSATGAPDGITSVKIKGVHRTYIDDTRQGKVQVKANRNPAFPVGLPLQLNPRVVAQFKYASGVPLCWEASFPTATTNTATQFKATAP